MSQIKFINRSTGSIEIETPPAEKWLKFIYGNPLGQLSLLPLVKRKFLSQWYGKRMNQAASAQKIAAFVQDLKIDMSEAQEPLANYQTFNEFFYRKLKPQARPLGPDFISPGDGRLLAFERLSEVNNFYVKGRKFTLTEFLGQNELAGPNPANSSMIILRLAPNDYHRYHFPYQGIPSPIQEIKGHYYSVSPHALIHQFTKVFCENKRQICRLSLANQSEVLIVPVGATMVGSMVNTYQPNQKVEKGQEMGYFAFGGSTIVLIFDAQSFEIDADLLKNTQNKMETYVKMGETIAKPRFN